MNSNPYQKLIAAVTGETRPEALAGIERIMNASVLHASLEFCSREQLVRGACIAARAWRNGAKTR